MSRRFVKNANTRRNGITVIEILFAMVIALVGLTGIAALLLLGGRQATESNQAAEGQALAQDWYAEFAARGLNDSANWVKWDDGYRSLVPLKKVPETVIKSFCIDPFFFSARDVNNSPVRGGAYNLGLFPYYEATYSPMDDAAMGTTTWLGTPRMRRVTWGYEGIAFPARFLEQVFASQDDLIDVRDNTDASVLEGRGVSFYESVVLDPPRIPKIDFLPFARFAAESRYSWLATVSPNEAMIGASPSDLCTLSLLVIKNRDRQWSYPPVRSSGDPATPLNNPQGERLSWVVPLSGDFNGGSGGRVRLVSSDGVESTIHVGDWVMLAKYYKPGEGFFRWYRVVALDSEAETGSGTDVSGFCAGLSVAIPNNKLPFNSVWWRDVVLDGPDWKFSPNVDPTDPPTIATLIKGTVSVYERIVNVNW